MQVISPVNGKVIAEVDEDSPQAIAAKFQAAAQAQVVWAARPFAERHACMDKFRKMLETRGEELAAIQSAETGKPIAQARGEIAATGPRIQYFLDHCEARMQTRSVHNDTGSNTAEEIGFAPLGVVANISAWNYPWFVGTNVFIPALLTGNAVLYKPSEFCPGIGAAIAEMMVDAGVPADVFTLVQGGREAGEAILAQPVDGVYFTGSYATGKKISETLAGRMVRLQMELGGKDAAYVADDVDVKKVAAATADGAFYNCGQSCCAIERIYVHADVYDDFVTAFVETVRGMKVGDPADVDTYIGPLCREAAIEPLEEQVRDALTKGGKLLVGGQRDERGGNYFQPTVISNASQDMLLMQEESFGPIIGIAKVKNDEEAITRMQDTTFGLAAGVYSVDQERARRVLQPLKVGTAYWNCGDRVSPYLPWTGRGHSGIGSTLSEFGIDAFLIPKGWHLRQP